MKLAKLLPSLTTARPNRECSWDEDDAMRRDPVARNLHALFDDRIRIEPRQTLYCVFWYCLGISTEASIAPYLLI